MTQLIPHLPILALGEVLTSANNMLKEIAHYKRAVAELEYQRHQMYEQAKIAHHQIDVQHKQAIHRINSLSASFKQTMQQNELFIHQHTQRERETTQYIALILQQMSQTNDLDTKKLLQQVLQEFLMQLNANREESARLQTQLLDAQQQFGLAISHRDQSFKDVF